MTHLPHSPTQQLLLHVYSPCPYYKTDDIYVDDIFPISQLSTQVLNILIQTMTHVIRDKQGTKHTLKDLIPEFFTQPTQRIHNKTPFLNISSSYHHNTRDLLICLQLLSRKQNLETCQKREFLVIFFLTS